MQDCYASHGDLLMQGAAHRYSFAIHVRAAAPPATVFALLADAQSWSRWSLVRRASLERHGDPPNGIGAIRRFSGGPFTSREQVVAYQPPSLFSYVLLSGLPVCPPT